MKLSSIGEGFMTHKIREALRDEPAIGAVGSALPLAAAGHDSGNRTAGSTSYPVGVPKKARHRKYFGMEVRPEQNV
jgi:hypothetical protein